MKSTTQHSEAISNTQEYVEENPNKEQYLLEREKIAGTPFTVIRLNNNWFIVMGDYRITGNYETKEQALEKLETDKWLLILHMVIAAIEIHKKEKEKPTAEQFIIEGDAEDFGM